LPALREAFPRVSKNGTIASAEMKATEMIALYDEAGKRTVFPWDENRHQ
jgi:hypothetical protein